MGTVNRISCVAVLVAVAVGSGASQGAAADLSQPAVPSTVAPAVAAPSPWFVRLGAAGVYLDSSASVKLMGAPFPGASATASDNYTAVFDIGYYIYPNISITFTGGYPPTTTLTGRGAIAPFGTVGKATYGPAILTAQYHFDGLGAFKPYLGGGVAYAIIVNAQDGAVSNLRVEGAPGAAIQAGFDYAVDQHWGVFVDVKKLFLKVDANAELGPVPVSAKITLDPLIVSTGISYRF